VFGVDPKQAARHREILGSSGAKSDKGDAHALADMVRTLRLPIITSAQVMPLRGLRVAARAPASQETEPSAA
jgi:hypothetical protein